MCWRRKLDPQVTNKNADKLNIRQFLICQKPTIISLAELAGWWWTTEFLLDGKSHLLVIKLLAMKIQRSLSSEMFQEHVYIKALLKSQRFPFGTYTYISMLYPIPTICQSCWLNPEGLVSVNVAPVSQLTNLFFVFIQSQQRVFSFVFIVPSSWSDGCSARELLKHWIKNIQMNLMQRNTRFQSAPAQSGPCCRSYDFRF